MNKKLQMGKKNVTNTNDETLLDSYFLFLLDLLNENHRFHA